MRWIVALVVVGMLGSARAEHFAVRTFTTADGVANGRVFQATRDRNGFLWFATAEGLNRFDGSRFETFGLADGLPDTDCLDVLAASDGRVWVATDRGLAWLDLGVRARRPHFTAIHLEGDANAAVTIFEDSHRQLWFGTEAGLWRLGPRDVPELVSLRPRGRQPAVYAVVEDRGTFWLGTSWGLWRRLADGSVESYRVRPPEISDDRTISLLLDHTGRLWIGSVAAGPFALLPPRPGVPLLAAGETLTSAASKHAAHDDNGLVMPRVAGEVMHYGTEEGYPFDAPRRSILEDSHGAVWFAGEHTMVYAGKGFESRGHAQGMPEDSLSPLLEDATGSLWFGGNTTGVTRYLPSGLVTYDDTDGLASPRAVSVTEDAEGRIYAVVLGPQGHTLCRFDRDHFVAIQPMLFDRETIGGWSMTQVGFFDRDERWWQATQTGLDHYPRVRSPDDLAHTHPEHFGIADGLPGRDIQRLFGTRSGDVWISTGEHIGLARWRRDTNKIEVLQGPRLPTDQALAFAEDRTGAVWVGYRDGSLVRIDHDGPHVFGKAEGWESAEIDALLFDAHGMLWVGTTEGLARVAVSPLGPGQATWYRAGLASEHVMTLADDANGRIYAGTIHGVERIDPATGQIQHITVADGLPNDFVLAARRDTTGQLWFAGLRGVARMTPRVEPIVIAPTYVTSARAGDEELALEVGGARSVPAVEVRHDASNLDLTFTSPSYAIGVPVEFQVRLSGRDEDAWSPARATREVHYTHIAPGHYQFSVRAVVGGVVAPAATLELEVLAPLWQRAWFLGLIACCAAALAWRIYRWRVDHLIAVERVRSRIASDLHDDLGASLARISVLSEVAARRTDGVNELVATIGRDARDLMESASDVVWATDPRHDDLAHVLTRIRAFAGELLDGPGIAWTLTAPRDAERIALGPDQRRHLYLILKEAVANIARHAGATCVTISVETVGRGLVATVEDDGCGIAADAKMGHGLENMRVRAREAGGSLTIAARPSGGTRITLAMRTR